MRARGVLVVLLAALVLPASAWGSTAAQRLAAIHCSDGMASAPRAPVLLIHGTGVNAEQNWSWGYQKVLLDRGHGVCTVDLPERATVDIQDSVRYTVTAIRETARRGGGRRIATIGHSQGASQAVIALRLWPQLAPLVDDVIGLSGAYDRGSDAIAADCAKPCSPAFWQFRPGSRFLTALARHPLPPGPSYTAIGTLYDTVVTPQPEANVLRGARSIEIQDICPGRRFAPGLDHIYMAADAVAEALAVDALDHPGPADPKRISPATCALQVYPGTDVVKLATLAPELAQSFQGKGATAPVDHEPSLRCPLAPGCEPGARVVRSLRLVHGPRAASRRVVLRVHARTAGALRARFGHALSTPVRLEPGRQTVRVGVPRGAGAVRRLVVETRAGTGPWFQVGHLAW